MEVPTPRELLVKLRDRDAGGRFTLTLNSRVLRFHRVISELRPLLAEGKGSVRPQVEQVRPAGRNLERVPKETHLEDSSTVASRADLEDGIGRSLQVALVVAAAAALVVLSTGLGARTDGPTSGLPPQSGSAIASPFPSDLAQQGALTAVISNVVYSWSCSPLAETVYLFGNGTGGLPPYRFNWSFGDGSPTESGQNVSHTYSVYRVYNVTLWVTDNHGGNASTEKGVSSSPPPCPPSNGNSFWVSQWPVVVGFGLFGIIAVVVVVIVYLRGKKGQLESDHSKRGR